MEQIEFILVSLHKTYKYMEKFIYNFSELPILGVYFSFTRKIISCRNGSLKTSFLSIHKIIVNILYQSILSFLSPLHFFHRISGTNRNGTLTIMNSRETIRPMRKILKNFFFFLHFDKIDLMG